jgi:ketosteroid isomerase-like protein
MDEVDGRIVAEMRVLGEGRRSGAPIDQVVYHVIELRDGLVYRVGEYYDRAEAVEVARSQ